MKLFGFSRNGFLYIDNGNNLILQETTSDESNMMNKYASLMEYDRFEDANAAYNSTLIHQALKPKPMTPTEQLSSIDKRFQEDAINQMYDEQEGYHTGF